MKMLMKKLLRGVIALTVLAVILITVQISVDRNPFESLTTVVLMYLAAAGILLSFFGAAGWFVVWVVSRVARDKGAGNVGVASVSIATEGVIILVVLVVGSLWVWSWVTGGECPGGPDGPIEYYYDHGQLEETGTLKDGCWDGPYETYHPNGQLESKRTYRDGDRDGLWETYYENGQLRNEGTYKDGEKCGEWLEEGETVTYDPCPPGLEDGN